MINYEEEGVKELRNETNRQLQCSVYTANRGFTFPALSSLFLCLNRFYFLFLSTQS